MDLDSVKKVASLARLSLSQEELEESGRQLSTILDYVRLLDEVNLTDVAPLSHPVPAANIFRDDTMQPSLPQEAALANAPSSDGQYFLVPRILEEKNV